MEGPNHSTNQHRRSSTMVTSKARRHPISLANHRPCLLRCVLHWSIPQSNRVQRQRCPGSPFHQHLPRKRDAHARSVFVPTSHLFPGACPLLHYLLAEAPQVRQKAEKKLPTQGASEDSRVLDVLPVACEDTHLLVRSDRVEHCRALEVFLQGASCGPLLSFPKMVHVRIKARTPLRQVNRYLFGQMRVPSSTAREQRNPWSSKTSECMLQYPHRYSAKSRNPPSTSGR